MELLDHTLKNGLLANLLSYANVTRQPSVSKASVGGVSPTKSMYTSSPAFGTMKTAKNASPSLRLTQLARTLPQSPIANDLSSLPPPDLPLKEPLDIEFKLNKKLAKQLYLRELEEKVKSNRDALLSERELSLQRKAKKEADLLKKQ